MSSRSDADRPDAGVPPRPEMHIASNQALPARRHLRGLVIWFAAVLAIVLVAMLVSFGLGDQPRSQTNSTDAFAATARSLVQSQEAAPRSPATKTIASVLPSVVNVRVVKVGASASGQVGEAKAEGSGVVIAPNGVIVTNDHVVQGAVQVRVVFTDGHPTMPGTVVGTDPQHDIAVVKVDASGLNPATLGRSSELALADTVYAIGFPLDLGVTVTRGIVSGLDRSVAVQGESTVEHLVGLLQTDAAINPGNSGGPLVDASGHVVGIDTAGASAASADNVGFSIAIDDALPVIKQILTQPTARQAWLGVEALSVNTAASAAALGLDPSIRGAAVVGVLPSSPAAAAGIQAGDVIVSLDDTSIASAPALTEALAALAPGQDVTIELVTMSGRRSVDVRLGQRPPA